MYVPEHFKEEDGERIAAVLNAYPFALLITVCEGRPEVSHLPLVYVSDASGESWLYGHFARANSHWQSLGSEAQALAVFNGPHAYISPSWYERPGVPTWNYAAVHLHGKIELIEDKQALSALVGRMTETFETGQDPWRWPDHAERFNSMLENIVGFRMSIERVEAKFKLGQNRAEADRRKVYEHLSASVSTELQSLAHLMEDI